MKQIKSRVYIIAVFALIALGSLGFVNWICGMAFRNTCVELQEQYIAVQVEDEIRGIETSVSFGKDIGSYYGMDEILSRISAVNQPPVEAVLTGASGQVLYTTLRENDEGLYMLGHIISRDYQEKLGRITEKADSAASLKCGDFETMVFPMYKNGEEFLGRMIVVYRAESLIPAGFESGGAGLWQVWAALAALLALFYAVKRKAGNEPWYIRFMPVILIMCGMLLYIVGLFNLYQDRYNAMITENAECSAGIVRESIDNLLDKGFDPQRIAEVSDYISQKVADNDSIGNISIGRVYYNSSDDARSRSEDGVLHLPIEHTDLQMDIQLSRSYIEGRITVMTLTFAVIFVICLMITYELTYLGEIISVRMSDQFNRDCPQQYESMSSLIRLLSFASYTAIYTSMSYTAVIMRGWGASVFGLSPGVSASLPLTVELSCIMLGSVVIQKVFRGERTGRMGIMIFPFLILGNLACTAASSPYVLIGLRAFCGIGFAFLKYWMNLLVAAGSRDAEGVRENCARFNGGLLGGITVGASLGAILAQAMGYQSNYYFTVLISVGVMAVMLLCVPFRFLDARRGPGEAAVRSEKKERIFTNAAVLKVLLLGCVPLNIGLMYVVAFLPVYMDNAGQPALATSYAYLVNGLSGVYLGVVLVSLLKKLPQKFCVVLTMLLGAAGILVLTLNSGLAVILISAAVMGLFDGFGTPGVTGYFTGMPEIQKRDTAGMLTIFNSVGSGVQILCPMLYNILIQPDGRTWPLRVFGMCYIGAAALFLLLMGGGRGLALRPKEG